MFDDPFSKKPKLPGPPPQTATLLRHAHLPAHRRATIDDPRIERKIVEEGAREVGIRFRKDSALPKPSLLMRDGVTLTARHAKVLNFLRDARFLPQDDGTLTQGWTTASQIAKFLGEDGSKNVRKTLEFLTFHKWVEWRGLNENVVVYRYVMKPEEEEELQKIEAKIEVSAAREESVNPGMSTSASVVTMETRDAEPPELSRNKNILFVADQAHPENQQRLSVALGASSIDWLFFGTRSPRQIEAAAESIERGTYGLVLLANSYMGHTTSTVLVNACKKADVPYIYVHKGRFSAVMREVRAYGTPGVKISKVETPKVEEVLQRSFRPTDTLLPIVRTLARLSPTSPMPRKEVISAALEEMGLTMQCMGSRSDGRPEVLVPFTNGAALLHRVYGCLEVEGHERWIRLLPRKSRKRKRPERTEALWDRRSRPGAGGSCSVWSR